MRCCASLVWVAIWWWRLVSLMAWVVIVWMRLGSDLWMVMGSRRRRMLVGSIGSGLGVRGGWRCGSLCG